MTEERRIGPAEWPEAIATTDGPQLVVAGPGTGKTEFLVRRAVHLIQSGKAGPEQILVLTFSRRAANDLRNRIADGVNTSWTGIAASTFHSFAFRLLEAHSGTALGWGSMPSLLTGPEHIALVHDLLLEEDGDQWPAGLGPFLATQTLAVEMGDMIMRSRELLLGGAEIAAMEIPEWQAVPAFLQAYDRRLEAEGRIDYGTLLLRAVECLEAGVAPALETQYPYVLVDEFQDTSLAQARMLDLVTTRQRNITVAADPYQSIYGFRGAAVDNVISFGERFANGRPLKKWTLVESFRVPRPILDSALRVVAGGALPGGAGEVEPATHQGQVEAYVFDQATAEAEWIAGEVERMHIEESIPFSAMAVLVRSKRHLLPELSRALGRRSIPHDPPESRLADHPAVRIVLDLVTAATESDPEEADRAVRRILLGPLFTLGLSREREIWRLRRGNDQKWPDLLREHVGEAIAVADLIESPRWATEVPAADGFWTVWSGIPQFGRVVHEAAMAEHRAALASLAQSLYRQKERDARVTLRDYARMTADDDFEASPLLSFRPGRPQLTLTTLHQAKGLEFDVVFIADALEGVFPDNRRTQALIRLDLLNNRSDDPEGRKARLQEEMRLAYTAMTRTRRRVVWSATSAGLDETESRPSRFLLAAAGVTQVAELDPPPPESSKPLTPATAQSFLRRTLTDAAASASERLAALSVLAHPPEAWWDARRFPGVAERGPDHGVVDLPLTLSPSQADSYESCPRRYVLETRLRLQGGDFSYGHFGNLMHEVLERSERTALTAGEHHADLPTALAKLADVWSEKADFGSPVLTEAWRVRGEQLLTQLYGEWPAPEDTQLLDVERRLSWKLDEVTWRGRADRVERLSSGGLRIVDYKTSKNPMSKEEAAASLQLGFYLCASGADAGLMELGEPQSAVLWYPLAGANRTTVRDFDMQRLGEVGQRLLDVERGITAEQWPARPSKACTRCEVRLVCPAWPEGREAYAS